MSEKYREAGVDLEAATESVSRLVPLVKRTHRAGVLGNLGGFGGLFSLRDAGFTSEGGPEELILVSGTDGVGTKLELAISQEKVDTIGIDCVAMCVNDVLTTGAEPLFFLDYVATGKLEPGQIEDIVAGVAQGCIESKCALIGGETAEMPGFYPEGSFDIAGFCVGAAKRKNLFTPAETIRSGDILIGFASSGVHSNGYSLVRKLVRDHDLDLSKDYERLGQDKTLGEHLLEPTRLYVQALSKIRDTFELDIRGAAHITGGGLPENLARVVPDGYSAIVDTQSWQRSPLFTWLEELAAFENADEAYHVFNMGVGFVLVVSGETSSSDELERTCRELEAELGHAVWVMGEVVEQSGEDVRKVVLENL